MISEARGVLQIEHGQITIAINVFNKKYSWSHFEFLQISSFRKLKLKVLLLVTSILAKLSRDDSQSIPGSRFGGEFS